MIEGTGYKKMPTYQFRNKKTGEFEDHIHVLTISEMEQYEKDHPELEAAITAPLIHSGRGLKKPEDGFRDLLKTIKRNNRKGQINTF